MANPELIQALDYILNRSDEASIEVLAAAVVRRRRDIALFGDAVNMPDPRRMAHDMQSHINASIGAGVDDMRVAIREMTIRIIRREAPELTDEQAAELCRAWIPEPGKNAGSATASSQIPRDLLSSMIQQFVAFSLGTMSRAEDQQLRDELGAWPERYWKAFPPVIRSIITDYIKERITENEYVTKIGIALEM